MMNLGYLKFLILVSIGLFMSAEVQSQSNPFGGYGGAQEEAEPENQEYGYCNMFYLNSRDTTVLPFKDFCFVNDIHKMDKDYLAMRYVGPVWELQELFVAREWGMYIYMSPPDGPGVFPIVAPGDIDEQEGAPPAGKAFVYLAHNKGTSEYDFESYYDKVDFRGVSGKIIIEPIDPELAMSELYKGLAFEANLEVYFQEVNTDSGSPELKGSRIRVKSTFYIKDLDVVEGED